MIYLTIVAAIAIVVLAALLAVQARAVAAERSEWRAERRFLTDRAIASHVGEVVALEREDTRKSDITSLSDAAARRNREERLVEGIT